MIKFFLIQWLRFVKSIGIFSIILMLILFGNRVLAQGPTFVSGTSANFIMCTSSTSFDISSLLSVTDVASGPSDTWSIAANPTNGSLSGFDFIAPEVVGVNTPSGLIYTPTIGYVGTDNFTIQISDGTNTNTIIVTVSVNPSPTITTSGDVAICTGNSTTISASGGTTYSWSPTTGLSTSTDASVTANPTSTITYTVTGTTSGCDNTATLTVSVNPLPTITTSGDVTICSGTSITLSASGGTTYSWSPTTDLSSSTGGSVTANPTSTVTYTVTGTTSGCDNTATLTVSVNPIPTITTSGDVTICSGTSTTLSASGGTTYSWSPTTDLSSTTSGSVTANPTSTVTYTVTGTTSGCDNTATLTVSVNPSPTITTSGDVAICSGNSTTLIASGGTSYSWSPSTGLSTSTDASITANPTSTVTYTVTGTTGGCSSTAMLTVSVNPIPTITTSVDVTICSGTSTTLSASGGTTYSWSPTTDLSSSTGGSVSANPTSTVTYTVIGTTSGCDNTATLTVSVNPLPIITSSGDVTICSGTSTTLSASGGTTYSWSPTTGLSTSTDASVTANPTSTVTYTVTGTTSGCDNTATLTVSVNPLPTITTSGDVAICTGNSTTISASGGTTYSWSPTTDLSSSTSGSVTANPTSIITYTVTGTTSGCSSTATLTVSVNPIPIITTSGDVTICSGTSTTLNASGGTTYSWSPTTGLSTSTDASVTANPTSTTTYTVTGTTSGCSNTAMLTVSVNPLPIITSSGDVTICSGNSTTLSASGGTTYSWSPTTGLSTSTDASETANPTSTITYTVTGTTNGCSSTALLTVSVNPIPTIDFIASHSFCATTIDTVNFTGSDLSSVYNWTNDNTSIDLLASGSGNLSFTSTNSGYTILTANITVQPTAHSCPGISRTFTISINPLPTLSNTIAPAAICDSTLFSYLDTSLTVGTVFSWSRALQTGITNAAASGTGNPLEYLVNSTVAPITVVYVDTLTANGCSNIATVSVVVNPKPTLSNTLAPTPICDSTLFSYLDSSLTTGTTFAWSRNILTGITNPAASGIGNPNEYLENTTTNPIVVTYIDTLYANGCSNFQAVQVTVNPKPFINNIITSTTVCDSTLFVYLDSSLTTGVTYSWSRTTVAGILNPAASGTGSPNEYLNNTTLNSIAVTYIDTITINGCQNFAPITVTVNPKPILSNVVMSATICDSNLFSYLDSSLVSGTTYSWSRAFTAGITNPAASGVGNPSEYLVNTTYSSVNVIYVDTLTANGCQNTQQLTVTVNPKPNLSSTLTPHSICDSTLFSYLDTSFTTGTTFTWSRDTVTGISNPAASGIGDINEYLINTTFLPITVTYIDTLHANGCINFETITVVVNSKLSLSNTVNSFSICAGATFHYTDSSLAPGVSFAWSRAAMVGISNPANSDTGNISEVLLDTTLHAVSVIYIDTIKANGCVNTDTIRVNVSPIPTLTTSVATSTICDSTLYTYVLSSGTTGTTLYWHRDSIAGISNPAASGGDSINEVLVNTTANPINVVYLTSLTISGCASYQPDTVIVNPKPVLSSTLSPHSVCDSALFTYIDSSLTVGTTYSWSRALVAGITNPADTGSGNINERLVNTTINPITVTYVDTLTLNGCKNVQTISVSVNPKPLLTNIVPPQPICDSALFSYIDSSSTAGVVFTWYRPANGSIGNPPASGSGSPNEYLINLTSVPVTVFYIDTLSINGCKNFTTDSVKIYPKPVLNTSLTPPGICDSTLFYYVPGSSIPGATFSWVRPVVSGVSNGAGAGIDSINEILVNTTADTVSVVYLNTISANGCTNTEPVRVVISPYLTVKITTMPPNLLCTNTMYQNFGTTTPIPGVDYQWTSNNATVWATGTTKQYCIVNFDSAGKGVVYLTAHQSGAMCSAKDSFVAYIAANAVSDTPEVFYSYPQFICQKALEDSYQWGYDDALTLDSTLIPGEINQYYTNTTPNFITKYYWVITMLNGCMQKTYVNTPLGTNTIHNTDIPVLSLYPNPTNLDYVNIVINTDNMDNVQLEICDVYGRVVSSTKQIKNIDKIDLHGFATGCYFVTCIKNGIKMQTVRFIKN